MKIDSFTGEFAFLSNFWEPEFGVSAEHIFQASKTIVRREQQEILLAPTPGKAKRLGRKCTLRADWDDVKVDIMRDILRHKFERDPLRQKLIDTGDAELIEGNHWHDHFWGVCEGKGENMLGRLLMEIRNEIRE